MSFPAFNTVDALMRAVFIELMKGPFDNFPTKSLQNSKEPNPTSERIGVMLQLTNPLARLSRSETRGTPISPLAELLWYFTGDNKTDFISYYLSIYKDKFDEDGIIYGGYGPRIFKLHGAHNQLEHIIKLLHKNPATRKAVIQIFDGEDIVTEHKDVPCTCTLQFLVRDGKLSMVTYMRSNDAYWGLPHDIFTFTMLQEFVARTLNIGIGDYFHSVGSLHLYNKSQKHVKEYLNEGYQSALSPMPPMPNGNQFPQIKKLLGFESKVRSNKSESIPTLDSYWADLARLLKIYAFLKAEDYKGISVIKDEMNTNVFDTHIDKKIDEHL